MSLLTVLVFATTARADHLKCWWANEIIFDVVVDKTRPETFYASGQVSDAWGVLRQSGEVNLTTEQPGTWPLPAGLTGVTYEFSDTDGIRYRVYRNLCTSLPGSAGPSLAKRLGSCTQHRKDKAWHMLVPWYYACKPPR